MAESHDRQKRQIAVDLIIIILFINLRLILHCSLIASATMTSTAVYSRSGAAYLHNNSAPTFL
jgi:hypothetical protein